MFGWFKKKRCGMCDQPLVGDSFMFRIRAFDGASTWEICPYCVDLVGKLDKSIKELKKKQLRGKD